MGMKEDIDSCLRVVSNRCRNLRKTIDRAKTWEEAAQTGLVLNDEQTESIRSVPRKEALLAELQEILKKQAHITQSHLDSSPDTTPALSKKTVANTVRASKSNEDAAVSDHGNNKLAEAAADMQSLNDAAPSVSKSEIMSIANDISSSIDSDVQNTLLQPSPAVEANTSIPPTEKLVSNERMTPNDAHIANSIASSSNLNASSTHLTGTGSGMKSANVLTLGRLPDLSDGVHSSTSSVPLNPLAIQGESSQTDKSAKILEDLEVRHSLQLDQTKAESIRHVLNLFHVVDFLRQPGSREALLAYFSSANASQDLRPLTSLDMDLLCYFNVMLTSPNGNVPHHEAVNVSTAHCLEFLKNSTSEAFKGTSYATLSDIVRSIAGCPILTDRGSPPSAEAKPRGRTSSRTKGRHSGRSVRSSQPVESSKSRAPTA